MLTKSFAFKYFKFVNFKVWGIIFISKYFFFFFEIVKETPLICIEAFSTIYLLNSLGIEIKKVEANEKETVILQRRSIRLTKDKGKGETLNEPDLIELRPCPEDSIPLSKINEIIGKRLKKAIKKGEYLKWEDLM